MEAAVPCGPSHPQRVIKQASHSNSSAELLLSEAVYKLGPFWWSCHISSMSPGDSTLSLSSVLPHGTKLPPNGLTGPHIVPLCRTSQPVCPWPRLQTALCRSSQSVYFFLPHGVLASVAKISWCVALTSRFPTLDCGMLSKKQVFYLW